MQVLLEQTCTATEDACACYTGSLSSVVSHFLVTAEQLSSSLELPHVFITVDLVSCFPGMSCISATYVFL